MTDSSPALKKNDYLIIIALLNFFVLLTLYQFRALDDNRLVSWNWIFEGADVPMFFFLIVIGIMAAFFLSRITFVERGHGLFLFLSSFLISILFFGEPEVIVDASRYFTQAKHIEVYGLRYFIDEWGRGIKAWTDLPVVPMFYGLIFKLFGESRLYMQIFTSLLFSSTILLTYKIGKALWDKETGFIAGALLLGIPYIYTQVPLMLVDIPAMFFLSLSVFTFIRALERGGIWPVLASISFFLSFYSKYSIWLMLSINGVIFLVFLLQRPEKRNPILKKGAAFAVIAGILIVTVFLYKYALFSGQIRLLQEYQGPGLRRWGESYLSTFLFQIHPVISIAALYSLIAALRRKDLKYLIVLWLVVIIFVLQINRIRYTLPAFPMLALMASYGLREIREKEVRRFLVSCAVLSSLILSIFFYLPFLSRMSAVNLKDAGLFLDSSGIEEAEVITITSEDNVINSAVSVPLLDIFTHKKLVFKYVPEDISVDAIKESSLRFTWEYSNPGYYYNESEYTNVAPMLVIISSESGQVMPDYILSRTEGRSLIRTFERSTGIFSYNTEVKVYQ
ncbi:MAG: glycosyltransferase family 39 protein [Thermodesulfovibrionia bacterium]|nr:glycosyltransferase family 39 protein [Thermodesulfovibrionia bacterium]